MQWHYRLKYVWISMQILLEQHRNTAEVGLCYATKPATNISSQRSHHYPRVPSLVHSIFIKFCLEKRTCMAVVFFCSPKVSASNWFFPLFPFRIHSMTSFFNPGYSKDALTIVNTAVTVHKCYAFFYCRLLDIWGKVYD